MEKQQAIDFVLERIAHDYTQEEIVRDLSRHLKAPPDVLQTFVSRIEEQHPHVRPEAQAELPAPDENPLADSDSQPGNLEKAGAGLPSAFLSGFDESAQPQEQPAAPLEAATPHASTLPDPESGIHSSPKVAKRTRTLEDQELAQIVLSMLKKGHKRSEITMFVCERTGIEWKQAQRFVAQVGVDHHKSIHAHQNVWLIGFGVLFALAGLVMFLVGVAALVPYLTFFTQSEFNLPVLVEMRPDAVIGVIVTGFGLLIGGIVGIILAVQGQSKA